MTDATTTLAPAAPRTRRRASEEGDRALLTPERWIEEATTLLVDQGIDSVKVDELARRLGVTRGSFYWHFRDREDLLRSVLQAWRDAATDGVIQRFERETADARELLRELISLPFRGRAAERAARVELAIRAWARRDVTARQAVDEVDARRISYIAQCFSALGYPIAEARSRGFVLYAWELGESLLGQQGPAAQRAERGALLEQLLLQPPGAGGAAPGKPISGDRSTGDPSPPGT